MIRVLFPVVSCALMLVTGCEEYTSLQETDDIVFMKADKNFRFMGSSYPKGSRFPRVAVDGGRQAVWIDTAQASTAAGGMGAPVMAISVKNKNGMMLDENLCSTGDLLVHSIGVTTVHEWDNYVARESITKGVCFSITQ